MRLIYKVLSQRASPLASPLVMCIYTVHETLKKATSICIYIIYTVHEALSYQCMYIIYIQREREITPCLRCITSGAKHMQQLQQPSKTCNSYIYTQRERESMPHSLPEVYSVCCIYIYIERERACLTPEHATAATTCNSHTPCLRHTGVYMLLVYGYMNIQRKRDSLPA